MLAEFDTVVEAARCAVSAARRGRANEPDAARRTAHRDADRDQSRRRHRRRWRRLRRRCQHRGAGRARWPSRAVSMCRKPSMIRSPTRSISISRISGPRTSRTSRGRSGSTGWPARWPRCRKNSSPRASRSRRSPPAFDDRRAIAVLPFANFSGDPEQEFFADGITEDIISMLAGWRAFPVIARASTFTYKGQTVDIKKVGRGTGRALCPRGQRAQIGSSGSRHGAADPSRYRPSHHGRKIRPRPDRSVRITRRDHPRYCRRDRAGTPQIRARAHRRAAANRARTPTSFTSAACSIITGRTSQTTSRRKTYFRRALAIDAQYPQATAASLDRAVSGRA